MLIVPSGQVVSASTAVDNVQMDVGMFRGKLLQQRLERVLAAVANAIEQMQRAVGLLRQTPAQHAHHWGNADAARDQYDRNVRIRVDAEMARRRLDLEDVAFVHVVMKVIR